VYSIGDEPGLGALQFFAVYTFVDELRDYSIRLRFKLRQRDTRTWRAVDAELGRVQLVRVIPGLGCNRDLLVDNKCAIEAAAGAAAKDVCKYFERVRFAAFGRGKRRHQILALHGRHFDTRVSERKGAHRHRSGLKGPHPRPQGGMPRDLASSFFGEGPR